MNGRRLPTTPGCGCIPELDADQHQPERPTKAQRLEGVRKAIADYHERQKVRR